MNLRSCVRCGGDAKEGKLFSIEIYCCRCAIEKHIEQGEIEIAQSMLVVAERQNFIDKKVIQRLKMLLDNKRNINHENHAATTSVPLEDQLVEALSKGDIKTAKLLIVQGANVNINVDVEDNEAPLLFCYLEDSAILSFLLENGADPSSCITGTDGTRWSALYLASEFNLGDSCKLLINHGADPNRRVGPDGRTPLHAAVLSNCRESVKFLMILGANPNIKDNSGISALSEAKRIYPGQFQFIPMLLEGYAR